MVAAGAVATRAEAKVGMLGAMYGGTTGEGGAHDAAADPALPARDRAGRGPRRRASGRGGQHAARPRLRPGAALGGDPDAGTGEARRRRRRGAAPARAWGRFTRNFVVQGTAAEWALCWLAALRNRLARAATGGPHLVFFLHDEVVVDARPSSRTGGGGGARGRGRGGRLLFGDSRRLPPRRRRRPLLRPGEVASATAPRPLPGARTAAARSGPAAVPGVIHPSDLDHGLRLRVRGAVPMTGAWT